MEVVKSLFFGDASIAGAEAGTAGAGPVDSLDTDPKSNNKTKYKKPRVAMSNDFILKVALFALLWILVPFSVLVVSLPLSPLRTINHKLFRNIMRHVERSIGSLAVLTAYLFMPGSALVLSGDVDKMTAANSKKKVVLANHQAYPDWLYLWATAWVHNLHGDFRVMMIKVLSLIPIYGTVMDFFDFIYLNQKLDKDRPILKKNLGIARKEDLPLWMLIFPEGTLNTPGNIEKSKKFAEKMQIAEHPNHCILPKSTGLFYTIQDLQPTCTDVFDLTIGYSNVTPGDIPFEVMNPIEVFFNGRYPKTVHIHCRQYSVPEIPGFEPDMINQPEEDRKKPFDTWLRTIWLEKDTYLARFYETKKMTAKEEKDGKLVPLIPRSEDFLYLFMVLLGGYLILPVYVRLAYWALYAVLYVVYWALWVVFKVVGFSRLTLWIAALLFLDGLVRGKRKATVTQA